MHLLFDIFCVVSGCHITICTSCHEFYWRHDECCDSLSSSALAAYFGYFSRHIPAVTISICCVKSLSCC